MFRDLAVADHAFEVLSGRDDFRRRLEGAR
jgi:hypothetical protein